MIRYAAARAGTGWNRFWFEPAAPTDLGAARMLFCAGVLLAYLPVDFSEWGSVAPGFWMPMPLFARLHLGPLPPAGLSVVEAIWRVALVSTAIGFRTRVSATIAAVTGIYLLGLPHNFGHTFHFDALLSLTLIVLAVSRCADALSLDALMQRRQPEPSAEYRWPIRMVWCLTALVFGAAGFAKLRYGGLDWITSSNMQVVLRRAAYHTSDADPITGAGLWLAMHPLLCQATAALSVAVEFGFPLALFSRRLRAILVPSGLALLVGIRILMGPTFGGFLVVNVFWVPWERVLAALRVRASSSTHYAFSPVVPRPTDSVRPGDTI